MKDDFRTIIEIYLHYMCMPQRQLNSERHCQDMFICKDFLRKSAVYLHYLLHHPINKQIRRHVADISVKLSVKHDEDFEWKVQQLV